MTTDQPEYSVSITKAYKASPQVIFNLFKNNTVFKLTGADIIESNFEPEELFRLTFTNRGVIYGRFIEITNNRITAEWNVTGFEKPDETATALQIQILGSDNNCMLTLQHTNIKHQPAAFAKQKAWTEILDALEGRLNS